MMNAQRMSVQSSSGFGILEVMVVLGIMALLAAVSLPIYRNYTSNAQATEIVMLYDSLRSGLAAELSQGTVGSCGDLLGAVGANSRDQALSDHDARVTIGFDAVAGVGTNGYKPVMLVCGRQDLQGVAGLSVAKSVYEELDVLGRVSPGAVMSDNMVVFSAILSDLPTAACLVPVGATLDACGAAVAVPTAQAIAIPQQAAPVAVAVPSLLPNRAPQCIPPANVMVERSVMNFAGSANSYIVNNGDLDTGGDMRQLTAEIAFMGGQQVSASAGHGATILSYASTTNYNEFEIWNPESLTVSFGSENINTNLNINDGQPHRLTVSWDSTSGQILVYDNGTEAWRGTGHQGDVIRGNGKLAMGGDQDSYGGGFQTNDAFSGNLVAASMANVIVPAGSVRLGPINTAIDTNSGLITSIVATDQGFEDSTGSYTYTAGSGLGSSRAMVPSSLYVADDCS